MQELYIIGGSPCSGKSSIADKMSKKYGWKYYKVDDVLDELIAKGAKQGDAWLKQIHAIPLDQMWLKDPETLCQEELVTYEKIFPLVINQIKALGSKKPILAEGAAYLPQLVQGLGIDARHYFCLVPSGQFQKDYYAQREWIDYFLKPYADPEQAFNNWMGRDALFAHQAVEQARVCGYEYYVVDGSTSIEENMQRIERCFGLV